MAAAALEQRDFVWLVGSLCQLNGLPFDPALLVQRFPEPHSERQLLEALQSLGFRIVAGVVGSTALLCIAFLKGDSRRPAIVLHRDGGEFLYYFEARSHARHKCPVGDERFEDHALLLQRVSRSNVA